MTLTIAGPTFVFHRSLPARIVRTQAEYDALGEGWAETPAAFYAQETPEPEKPATKGAKGRK